MYLAHRLLDAGLSRSSNLLSEPTISEWRIWSEYVLQTFSRLQQQNQRAYKSPKPKNTHRVHFPLSAQFSVYQ